MVMGLLIYERAKPSHTPIHRKINKKGSVKW